MRRRKSEEREGREGRAGREGERKGEGTSEGSEEESGGRGEGKLRGAKAKMMLIKHKVHHLLVNGKKQHPLLQERAKKRSLCLCVCLPPLFPFVQNIIVYTKQDLASIYTQATSPPSNFSPVRNETEITHKGV